MTARDLGTLFDPRSIAIVGASDQPEKYGNWLARRALTGHRPTYLVNRVRPRVLGRQTAASLVELGEQVDLAVVAVPAGSFEEAVDDALGAGVGVIVGITSGLGELGGEHLRRQRAVVERVRVAGARLLGPNCLGLLDHSTGLHVCALDVPAGPVALLSQSGTVGIDLAAQLHVHDLGLSRFVSVGNQADIGIAEPVDACIEHDDTTVIALYSEGFTDGRGFARAAARANRAGKPVVLLTAGSGEAAARGAASHTGTLVSPRSVVQAVCDAAGVELVRTPTEMADLVQALVRTALPPGRRVAILADGGGHGSLAADALDARGLIVQPFTAALRTRVSAELPAHAGTSNPIDIAGAGERDIDCFRRVAEMVAHSSEVDAFLLTGCLGGYQDYGAELAAKELQVADGLTRVAATSGKPVVASLVVDRSPAARALRAGGVAVYRDIERAAWVLQRLTWRSLAGPPLVPETPAAQPPVREVGYWPARRVLTAAGLPFVRAAEVATGRQLTVAAAGLTYPLVLKALVAEHKSDGGGVVLNIRTREELLAAWDDLQVRLAPPSCSVEEMADLRDSVELIVGVGRDRAFDTVVLVGFGGTNAEVLRDTQLALGPVDPATASRMLGQLEGAVLFAGYRGRPALDVGQASAVVSRLSHFAAAHPEISEVECNPLAVTPHGVVALDARLVVSGAAVTDPPVSVG